MLIYYLTFLLIISVVKADPFAPTFAENIYTLEVLENQTVISQLLVIIASDIDTPLVFEQTSNFPEFQVTSGGILNLVQPLDREKIASYKLNVKVTDSTGKSSSTIVFVTVLDVNDNSPVFVTTLLQHTLAENTAIGTSLLRVSATDADSGINGFITFGLSDNPGDTFRISDVIGTFSLNKELNFEDTTHYQVVVVASDSGTPPRSTLTPVSITVTDSADLNPVFSQTSYSVAINEHSTSLSVVTVEAADSDLGVGDTINYAIQSGNDGNAFSIGTITGTIAVFSSSSIDRESHPNPYTLTIKAFETQNTSQSASVVVTIELLDINDQPPLFIGGPFSGNVAENTQIGYSVVTAIAASDADLGNNALFNFRIDAISDPGVFTINAVSGEVVVSGALDRETQSSYTFGVVVFDKFGATLSSTAAIVITVTDVNDNSPVFASDTFMFSVLEEQTPPVTLITITAVDIDEGVSGIVTYSLTGVYANRFQVDSSGLITTQSVLDREDIPSYEVNLVASDMDPLDPRESTTLLIITVEDINDQNPFFTPLSQSVDVIESVAVPHTLLMVSASDNDIGTNAVVSYSILSSSNTGNHFSITTDTGIISVTTALNRETNSEFTLLIVATDTGSRTGNGTVLVTVTDANTQDPVFSSSLYQATLPENTPLDTSVLQVGASDNDIGANAIITFSLIQSADSVYFKIDSKLGHIYIANSLDAETQFLYDFKVTAEDNGAPPRSATSQVQISVTDSNDHSPIFTPDLFIDSIPENMAISATIQVLTATDGDIETLNNRLNYSIISEIPNENKFLVLPVTGTILIRNELDRETTDFYTIIVQCVDIGGLSDTVTLQITVTDINDNPPIIQATYTFDYLENDVIGTKLGTVSATDADEPNTLNSQLEFSLIGGDVSFFDINPSSGEVFSTQQIDREATQFLTLNVLVADGGTGPLMDNSVISINVVDVNDNSPIFGETSYSAEVLEGTQVAEIVSLVSATDRDEGVNSAIIFSITGGNLEGHFSIGATSGEVQTTSVPTDRETTSEFELTLTASDTGTPSRQTTTQLRIIINDTNDNKPVFVRTAFFIELSENTSTNSVIVELSASDQDVSLSGSVRFQMVSATSFFSVDSVSGEVSLVASLDRESTDRHIVEIEAVDLATLPLTSDTNAILTISVTDANDNVPLFNPTPSSPVSVSEGESVGFIVDTYSTTDTDIGANAVVTFSVSGGEGGFEVDRITGELKIASQLDRETKNNYILKIYAIDGGSIPLSSLATVIISVTDINDNIPTFTPNTPTSVNIKENLNVGQAVATITATDTDLGSNKLLKYSIFSSQPGSGLNTFRIDEDTGQITVKTADIDRESIDSYILTILVMDQGTPQLSSSTSLNIIVVDVNDENPTFSQSVYTETVLESREVGSVVLSVSATDRDDGLNSLVTYSINGPESVKFEIDPQTGQISTTDTFDFETKTLYTFTVTAVDSGNATRQGTAEIRVSISDVNDNHPVLVPVSYSTELSEDAAAGVVVLVVSATDDDITTNAVVKFEKISGSADFSIDSDTGELKVARELDRELTSSYSVAIKGVDQGVPQLDSEPLIVQIYILDINDNTPQFVTPITTNISIPEDTLVATSVVQYFASDPDFGENGTITFTLTGSNLFKIGSATGLLEVAQILDRENLDFVQLTIIINDNGSPSLSNQIFLNIYITDTNDNPPIFDASIETTISIREDTIVGQVIVNTPATDADINTNMELTYRLVNSNPITGLTTFAMNEQTANLTIAIADIDREMVDQYTLKIESLDGGIPSLTANLTLSITITDFNDNTPILSLDIYEISISESTSVLSSIYRFYATDNDIGVNKEFDFSIQNGDSANFYVNATTGELSTLNTFDFEVALTYTFTIVVTDKGIPPLTTQNSVLLSIVDSNDNSPILTDTKYSKGLLEDFNTGATVFIFNASDIDSGMFGQIQFELMGIFSGFVVDLENGIMSSTGLFTGQVGRTFDFQIRAFDNKGVTPTLSDIENVHIVIISATYVVEMVLNRSPEFVATNQHQIEDAFTEAIKANVIIDQISPFYDTLNLVDPSKSTVNIHATHLTTNTLIEGLDLLRGIDEKESLINDLLFTAGIQLAEPVIPRDTTLISTELALIILSTILVLFIACCSCVLCMLVVRISRLRRRKQQYAKSYASLSTYFPSHSNISSPTELQSLTNPLYISPYPNSSFFEKQASLRYESQELTMELFSEDFESVGGMRSVVDLFDEKSGGVSVAIDSMVDFSGDEVSRVLVDFGSEDGSGISII